MLDRAEALRQVRENQLSALVIIPKGFSRAYLASTNVVALQLIKNPAQSLHPAVLEELLGALVTGLDAVKRQLGAELPEWQAIFDGDGDYQRAAELIVRAGDKLKSARNLLWPPRVSYTRPVGSHREPGKPGDPSRSAELSKSIRPEFNIFGHLLAGMAAMFLLFLGENASRDLRRELQQRTLDRFHTMSDQLTCFVASKAVFCLVFLLLCSAVMLGGSGLVFQIQWRNPLAIAALTTSYCLFAGGLMTLLPVLCGGQRGAEAMSIVTGMGLGLAGGSAFPASQLPGFVRDYITPWLPNYWYTETVRAVLYANVVAPWAGVALKIAFIGMVLMLLAVFLLRRKLERGAIR